MKDFIGNDLVAGDTVAYARRRSSSLWLNRGTVVENSGPYDGKLRVKKADTGNVVAIGRLDLVVKVSVPATLPVQDAHSVHTANSGTI